MTSSEILDAFIAMTDRAWWPMPDSDDGVLLMSAMASLSGFDCQTEDDLKAAVEHALSLVNAGVITTHDMAREAVRIDDELMEWGRNIEPELQRIAQSN